MKLLFSKLDKILFGNLRKNDLKYVFFSAAFFIVLIDFVIFQHCKGKGLVSNFCSQFGLAIDFFSFHTDHTPENLRPYFQSARWHHIPVFVLVFLLFRTFKKKSGNDSESFGKFWRAGIIIFIFVSPVWHIIHNVIMGKIGVSMVN